MDRRQFISGIAAASLGAPVSIKASLLGNPSILNTTNEAIAILCLGQSNAVGAAQCSRLANTDFNYKGIAAGYPTVRSGQDQYSTAPTGVYIYYKGKDRPGDWSADNGSWVALNASNSSANNSMTNTIAAYTFGSELALAQQIYAATGKEVFIFKPAWGGTALSPAVAFAAPGNWNFTLRTLAARYFIERGLAAFRAFRPNTRIRLAEVLWWQGEADATASVTKATYKAEWNTLKSYFNRVILQQFVVKTMPIWNVVELKFDENAAEAIIVSALQELVTEHADCRLLTLGSYPKKINMTAGEASPTAVGTPNADGINDDNHSSYIAQLAVGELRYNNISALL